VGEEEGVNGTHITLRSKEVKESAFRSLVERELGGEKSKLTGRETEGTSMGLKRELRQGPPHRERKDESIRERRKKSMREWICRGIKGGGRITQEKKCFLGEVLAGW